VVSVTFNSASPDVITNIANVQSSTADPDVSDNSSKVSVNILKRDTALKVDPVITIISSGWVRLTPRATLTDAITHAGVAKQTVYFSTTGLPVAGFGGLGASTPICSAVTDVYGVATCRLDIVAYTLPGVIKNGYSGDFKGSSVYKASHAAGAVLGSQ
jgi:hypothetical protein